MQRHTQCTYIVFTQWIHTQGQPGHECSCTRKGPSIARPRHVAAETNLRSSQKISEVLEFSCITVPGAHIHTPKDGCLSAPLWRVTFCILNIWILYHALWSSCHFELPQLLVTLGRCRETNAPRVLSALPLHVPKMNRMGCPPMIKMSSSIKKKTQSKINHPRSSNAHEIR